MARWNPAHVDPKRCLPTSGGCRKVIWIESIINLNTDKQLCSISYNGHYACEVEGERREDEKVGGGGGGGGE